MSTESFKNNLISKLEKEGKVKNIPNSVVIKVTKEIKKDVEEALNNVI